MTGKTRTTIAVLAGAALIGSLWMPSNKAQTVMLQSTVTECAMDIKPHTTGSYIIRPIPVPAPAAPEPDYPALNIALAAELQEHTWNLCQKYETPLPEEEFYELVLQVMWHESRYIPDVPDNHNANGTVDRGLMQINSCNWNRLKTNYGLDVDDPKQNIEAGVLMLSTLLEEYPVSHALTAYALGEAGAKQSGGRCTFSDEILNMRMEACMLPEEDVFF